jgi:hypothetical protein
VLAYRAIAIWLPAPFGAHAIAGLRRDTSRWSAEDARAAAPRLVAVAGTPRPAHEPQPLAA